MAAAVPPQRQDAAGRRAETFEPWQLFTLAGLLGATLVVFLSRGQSPAAVILLSLIIFGAAAVGIAALRTIAPLTSRAKDETSQVLGARARAALEREKALVLRSIKELEFDRAMGKMSEPDFAEMSVRLRARAAGLLRQLDAGGSYREAIERDIAQRVLAGADLSEALRPGDEPAEAAPRPCAACETHNDGDARFCKQCGAALRPPA